MISFRVAVGWIWVAVESFVVADGWIWVAVESFGVAVGWISLTIEGFSFAIVRFRFFNLELEDFLGKIVDFS